MARGYRGRKRKACEINSQADGSDNPAVEAGADSTTKRRSEEPRSDCPDEQQKEDQAEAAGPSKRDDKTPVQMIFNNCPFINEASGNTFNFCYDVGLKLRGPPGLMEVIESKVSATEDNSMSLKEIVDDCDAEIVNVKKGCVEVTLRVRSAEGLKKLLAMYSSGELERRLKADLPVTNVQIPPEAIQRGRELLARHTAVEACADSTIKRRSEEPRSLTSDCPDEQQKEDQAEAADDDDFGQKLPPLHIYLKRVLDKYPEGGQILKELVQNADDANAKNVIFLYDKTEHPVHHLWSKSLREFQGPALYAYNDTTFKDSDWKNIQNPEQSGKRTDPAKIGRFGLGFISVYHYTDMPCIVSGKKAGFLDPLEYSGKRGKTWDLSPRLLSRFPDQFNSYINDLFKCSQSSFENGLFEGTIFRFPLRKQPSLISISQFNDDSRMHGLFESFQSDAEISLLFLNNVESIAIYERDHGVDPKLICKVQVNKEDRHKVRLSRNELLSLIPQMNQDYQTMTCLRIEKEDTGPARTTRHIIVNTLKVDNISRDLQKLIHDDELKLLPWMGVSFQISSTTEETGEAQGGRVFCFLPLPESECTGLPVHVHGYFGLEDNRRSITWPGKESVHDNKARWNKLLSTEVFPVVYIKVILDAIDMTKNQIDPLQAGDVYKGWPHREKIQPDWSDGVLEFARAIANEAVVYTDFDGGSWMKPSEVVVDTTGNPLLSKVLSYRGRPVAKLPDHVLDCLCWAGASYQEITPKLVRDSIRADPLNLLTRLEKLQLLAYVASDSIRDLHDLVLLPLQNGNFIRFNSFDPKVYIATKANPRSLIPDGESKFAAEDLPEPLTLSSMPLYTQLKLLSADDVAGLVQEMLPTSWSTATDQTVSWTPGVSQNPHVDWLTGIWKWLTRNNSILHLGAFSGIPLIPVSPSRLARLQNSRLIFKEQESTTKWTASTCLSDGICSFLESVGAVVLRHDLPQDILNHPHLSKYIKAPTSEGVMAILEECNHADNLQRSVAKMSADATDKLRDLLAQLKQINKPQQIILQSLPLFKTSDGRYDSVSMCRVAVQSDYFKIPARRLKHCRIHLEDHESERLALRLGAQQESDSEFLKMNILPAVEGGFYSDEESTTIMTWVLEKSAFDGLVADVKFIPTISRRGSPSELYDPNNSTLSVLFKGNDVFPTGVFSCGQPLKFLNRVGLKTESSVTSAEVLECAIQVSQAQAEQQADVQRGSVLLSFLNCQLDLLFENVVSNKATKALWKFLEDLQWVPCADRPLSGYPDSAGWAGSQGNLYRPRDVGLIESALLQGSQLPLIRVENASKGLLNAFSWNATLDPNNYPMVERVVKQLKNMATEYHSVSECALVSSTVYKMFTFFSEAPEAHLKDLFKRHLGTTDWVWNGSGFASPDKMALSSGSLGVRLEPYLHIVPNELQGFASFLTTMGVKLTFQETALCTVLQQVKEKHEVGVVEDSYEKDLHFVCNILRYVVNLDSFDNSKILVPCRSAAGQRSRLIMEPASECLYVDDERLLEQNAEIKTPVIHESVSNDIAHRLDLKPLSHVIAPSDELDYGYDTDGPHETTVNAIRRNLEMYKQGVSILKELIQNADDAGATEVKFLIDWRTNDNTAHNLMSEGMHDCHGPALWAYNNACFTDDDIKNICSIAEQSKKHQLDKVGRFGLGFTSVYHITDIPSVVSGPYILICDPRTTHLGSRVRPGTPGIKLDLRKDAHRRTLRSYPNQFQPYVGIFGCDVLASSNFEHTLFRLPLRTETEVNNRLAKELSSNVFNSKEKIGSLMKDLKNAAETLLLFTQNVTHVGVFELENHNMNQVMSVSLARVQQLPRSISCRTKEEDGQSLRTERNILKATTQGRDETPETTMIVEITKESFVSRRGTKGKLERKKTHYIISCCAAQGEISDLAYSDDGRNAGVLPCGGVAAKLVSSGGGYVPECVMGQAFSYLPLDVRTHLPCHVNGSFLLQPNRRQLWSKTSSRTHEFESEWNTNFMASVLVRAFINLLEDLKYLQQINVVDAREFQKIWPRRKPDGSDFYPFVDAFYQQIGKEQDAPEVMYNQSRWVSVDQCFFIDWSFTDSKDLQDSVKSLLSKKLTAKTCIELDRDVVASIEQAEAGKCFNANTFGLRRFLEKVFFSMLEQGAQDIEPIHRNRVVLHLLDLRLGERQDATYDDILKDTECVPTSPEGSGLSSPKELISPQTRIGSLYKEEDCRFPHGEEFRTENRLLSLKQLGMATDDLAWEDICERVESMSELGQFDERSITLLKLIYEKLSANCNTHTDDQQSRIQNAAFLPVLQKPRDYPSEWYYCGVECLPATKLHEAKYVSLLGSVQPLLDIKRLGTEAMTEKVQTFLGFTKKQIQTGDVIEQLEILIRVASTTAHQTSRVAFCEHVYSSLQEQLCDLSKSGKAIVRPGCETLVERLCALRFVLCAGNFRNCKQLAFRYNGRSGPVLFCVPPVLYPFTKLLKICGVRDQFEVQDFVGSLVQLKERYKEEPLSDTDFKNAKAMLSEIVSRLVIPHEEDTSDGQNTALSGVFVPDSSCVLKQPSDMTYNDMEWEGSHVDEVYTHPDISYRDAKVIGIRTQREKYVDCCSSFGGFETDFGQSEELTDRLKNILMSYPNVSDVFKELLQNADDAGSTEIHFVYDPRHHETSKIVCDSWAEAQQCPALCCFNDKPFTEADIKGIQKVGVGGKRDDITTTGKFGIGFNAVYHLTDCPSFLSNGQTLCMFDPLLKFHPVTRKTYPGKRLETNEYFREKFPDMVNGYLEDIDIFHKKVGTVFRFPLRRSKSEISSKVYTSSEVEALLADFKTVAEEALLFLNNIKTISVSTVSDLTNELNPVYSITAELTEEGEQCREELVEHLKLFKDNPCEEVPPMCHVYNMVTSDSSTQQSWLISQMLGFDSLALDAHTVSDSAGLKKPLPRGGVAALITDSGDEQSVRQRYKAYCFLPLPVYTKLPVHVNGTFELDSARKNLEKGDAYRRSDENAEDGDTLIHRWNKLLVQHVIAPAYAKLIEHAGKKILEEPGVAKQFKDRLRLYDNLFPQISEGLQEEWRLLAKACLQYIGRENLKVLPVVVRGNKGTAITWHGPNSESSLAFFDGSQAGNPDSEPPPKISDNISAFLLRTGFNLLASSPYICLAFQSCGVAADFVGPKAVVIHLSGGSVIAPSLPAPLKKTQFRNMTTFCTLFEYCLGGIKHPCELNGLPIRLTNDGMVNKFSTMDGLYVTNHSRVLPCVKDRFLHAKLVTPCKAWFNKNVSEAYSSGIFKPFTLDELAQHLHNQLPNTWQRCHQHVEWTPAKNGQPSKQWLSWLWTFICSVTSEDNSSLDCISQWPIFPTASGKLVPPSLSKTVLNLHQLGGIGFESAILHVLRKLALPEISREAMCEQNTQFRSSVVLSASPRLDKLLEEHLVMPTSRHDVVGIIRHIMSSGINVNRDLSLSECKTLLHYFQEDQSLSEECMKTIKQLQIFELWREKETTDLANVEHVHTAESIHIPMDEARIWMDNYKRCTILEPNRQLELIYKKLGITSITGVDIYLKYILPSFLLLSQEARLKHVLHIRDRIVPTSFQLEKEAILRSLSCIEFIEDRAGIRQQAGYFFDPANAVFEAMVDPGSLLPKSMQRLSDFLELIGLHTKVTQDDFIKFAKDVETRASNVKDKIKRKTLCDISYLLTNELDLNDTLRDATFLHQISTIKFIPSVPIKAELLHIHPALSESTGHKSNWPPFIAYRGAIPERYLELVWSVSMVLPKRAIPSNSEITKGVTVHGCLGIETGVVTDKVLSHTQNVCVRMKSYNAIHKEDKLPKKERETLKSVMKKILMYLSDTDINKRVEIKRRMQCTPVCLVEEGRVLVRANQLVFDMSKANENSLRPHLYKAPRELADYDEILRLLGAQESCSFDQLAGVLESLKTECAGEQLGPNEKGTVVAAVRAIFTLLDDRKGLCQISVERLYLPSSEYFMREAPHLYYADPDRMSRYKLASSDKKFVIPLQQCGFDENDEARLIQLLPEVLRPKNLEKEMIERPLSTNEDCPAGQDCEFVHTVKRKVNSEEMTRVFMRLLRHQSSNKDPSDHIKENVTKLQGFGNFVCKADLKLALYDNQGSCIAKQTYSRKAYFDANTSTILLNHNSKSKKIVLFREIANSCNGVIGGALDQNSLGLLASALQCRQLSEMNDILTESDIPEYDKTTRGLPQDEHHPGTTVPLDIRHLLDQDPYNIFQKDEIVAYERYLDEICASMELEFESTREIIYAKIFEQLETEGRPLSKCFRIDIGRQEPITVKVTALYKFLRPQELPESAVGSFSSDSTDEVPTMTSERLPVDFEDYTDQIRTEVEEVFKLPADERTHVLRRLYRKWHPDKHPGQQKRATAAFQFLKQGIERHEKGQGSSNKWSNYYSRWDSEVNKDREDARRYQEQYHRNRRHTGRSSSTRSGSFVPPSFSKETPEPRKARLWFQQAKGHFSAAEQTSRQQDSPLKWMIAFQIHQAAETALKAAQYSLDGRPDMDTNDLSTLARNVCRHRDVNSNSVSEVTQELIRMDCAFEKPRYPRNFESITSEEAYRDFHTEGALTNCKRLLELVQEIIGIKVF